MMLHSEIEANNNKMGKADVRVSSKPTKKDRFLKVLKIAIPHIAIYLALTCYLLLAAYIFYRLEDEEDRSRQLKRLKEIQGVYSTIAREVESECGPGKDPQLYKSLSRLSTFMEHRPFELRPDEEPDVEELLPPRWNKMSSLLFALSVLTTTGYPYANPTTTMGQCVAICYGLFGIPLMVLAAVDIGRFLSDIVIWGYTRYQTLTPHSFCTRFFKIVKKPSIVSQVETKAINVLRQTAKRRSWRGKRMSNGGPIQHLEEAESLTPQDENKSVKSAQKQQHYSNGLGQVEDPSLQHSSSDTQEEPKKRLPLSVNASFLLLFCMAGGVIYVASGGNNKSFVEGFFVTFNLVANLTMGEVPNDFANVMTVIYITLFVVFGVAVLSMSADLAAGELKWVFLKIHYFGRKINWKRRNADKGEIEMEVEVKELLRIITQIRATHPEKDQITHVDILEYMAEMKKNEEAEYYMKKHRRDTIAFMPQSIEALKFADDMDLDDASHRSEQIPVPIPYLDSESSSLLDIV